MCVCCGGEMRKMQVEYSEKYLKADYIRENKITSLKILNEGEMETGQYGQKLCLRVLTNGIKFKWTLNATNKDNLIKLFGRETTEWTGKEVKIGTKIQDNGKLGIFLTAEQF